MAQQEEIKMVHYFQVWNGKEWETKFFMSNDSQVEAIRKEMELSGFRVIVVGDGYMPKPSNSVHENVMKALLDG